MRLTYILVLALFLFSGLNSYSQDTTLVNRPELWPKVDTCKNYVGPTYFGCGHPDFGFFLCPEYELETLWIFDRWGSIVFSTNERSAKWDFKGPKGELIHDGAYFYRLKYLDHSGNPVDEKGQFSLIK